MSSSVESQALQVVETPRRTPTPALVPGDHERVHDGHESSPMLPSQAHHDDPLSHMPRALAADAATDPSRFESKAALDAIPSPPRPTGRVVLEALDRKTDGASPVSKSSTRRRSTSSSTSHAGEERRRSSGSMGGGGEIASEHLLARGTPPALSISLLKDNEAAGSGSDSDTPHQAGQAKGARGQGNTTSAVAVSGPTDAETGGTAFRRVLPGFFQSTGKGGFWGASSQASSVEDGDGRNSSQCNVSTSRTCQSGEEAEGNGRDCQGVPWQVFPDGHDHSRAKRNWRVLRAVLMAIGGYTGVYLI